MTAQAALLSQAHAWLVPRAAKRASIPSPKQAKIAQYFSSSTEHFFCRGSGRLVISFVVVWKVGEKFLLGEAKNLPCQTDHGCQRIQKRRWNCCNWLCVFSLLRNQLSWHCKFMAPPESFLVSPSLLQTDLFSVSFCFLHRAASQAGAVIRLSTMRSIKWQ